MWKLIIGALALVFSASISEGGRFSDSKYFDNKLDEIQGAIDDTVKAGLDLRVMEGSLQRIVAASSYFFRTESATEYAVDAENYINGWIATGLVFGFELIFYKIFKCHCYTFHEKFVD